MADQRSDRSLGPRVSPGLRNAQPQRRPIGFTLKRHRPAERGDREVRRGQLGVGSVRAEGRDPDMHDLGIRREQPLESQPGRIEQARWTRVEDEVGALDQPKQRVPSRLGLEVDLDRTLVAVVRGEAQAAQRLFRIVRSRGEQRPRPASQAAAAGLDANDVRAEVAENHARELTPDVRQVENAIGREQVHRPLGSTTDRR